MTWIGEVPLEERFALLMQANFAEIGIQSEIRKIPWALFAEQVSNPDTTPNISQVFVTAVTGDPDTPLLGVSAPSFVWAVIRMPLFAFFLPVFPIAGRITDSYAIAPVTGFLLVDTLLAGDPGARVRGSGGYTGTVLSFEFLILTAARSREVRGARWSEIDRDGAVWAIPTERMKACRKHRAPLSLRALEVLDEAAQLLAGDGLVFPSPTGRVPNHSLMAIPHAQAPPS